MARGQTPNLAKTIAGRRPTAHRVPARARGKHDLAGRLIRPLQPASPAHPVPLYLDRSSHQRAPTFHRFAAPERMRHPMPTHPHAGDACPTCDHSYAWGEGPRLPRNFVFTYQEAAKILFEVGRGMTLRATSAIARDEALRRKQAPRPDRQRIDEHRIFHQRSIGLHGESTEATLAAAYLDTLAP